MNKPLKKEIFSVQLMLVVSLLLGVIPPLIMFLMTRKKNLYYCESSRKALNFHLTIFPLFIISSLLPAWVKYALLAIETLIIMYAIIRIAFQKTYYYPAIPYIKSKEENIEKRYSHVR
ncbi:MULTISPECIES: DUF4870 domain-containing protein [Sporosarcina]|uniref:DUF4870 domain-containing protein n=1 Tax=Sporosarcina newyorkensis TaxID=759851 RepID=A0A1T4YLT5_9BACL|nr:DUF4870 domain-containing protein [Sporosarcina newyorkensis]SKB02231.1 protein of unknown function [Sporosarcina newyorkensis]